MQRLFLSVALLSLAGTAYLNKRPYIRIYPFLLIPICYLAIYALLALVSTLVMQGLEDYLALVLIIDCLEDRHILGRPAL